MDLQVATWVNIQAPEANTAAGRNATIYLRGLIEYQNVTLQSHGKGYYGRT